MTAHSQAVEDAEREKLIDLIRQHLTATYHCTRVWEAWNVGTMSQDDFADARESDMPYELADAILAELTGAQGVTAPAQAEQPASNTLKSAREIGEKGVPHSESERLLFEEYMRGHCWKCDSWVASKAEYYDPQQRILYAVFRARAAIAQPVQPVQPGKISSLISEIRGASEVILVNARLDGLNELYRNSIARIALAADTLEKLAQPVQPKDTAPVPVAVGCNQSAAVREFIEDYEMIGESKDGRDACYRPNERERVLIEDAIHGFLASQESFTPPGGAGGSVVAAHVFTERKPDVIHYYAKLTAHGLSLPEGAPLFSTPAAKQGDAKDASPEKNSFHLDSGASCNVQKGGAA